MTKCYVKISEAICTDPECCGGQDSVSAVTLSKEIADMWNKEENVHVDDFDLTEVTDGISKENES